MFGGGEPKAQNALPKHDWKFGTRSLRKMSGVDDDLVRVAHLALSYSSIDFGVTCGLRTEDEQRALVDSGKSQTMDSKHLKGQAIDVVAMPNGKVSWELKDYVVIAQAFAHAARELNVKVRWGGAWTELLNQTDAQDALDSYVALRRSQGRRPFIDGPHFELKK